jgi:LemA protein
VRGRRRSGVGKDRGEVVVELWIPIALVAAVLLWVVTAYNRLVRSRVRIDEAWAQIDAQLQRRHDLIPNLVESVKGYAAHERATFEEVTAARARAVSVSGPADLSEAENVLTQALGRLLAIAEAYPDLKADANFRRLQEELAHTENMVAGARGHYNASVRTYDEARQVFPTSLVAGTLGFGARDYFEVETVEVRSAPDVSFG